MEDAAGGGSADLFVLVDSIDLEGEAKAKAMFALHEVAWSSSAKDKGGVACAWGGA
jgi:hypothetical protein